MWQDKEGMSVAVIDISGVIGEDTTYIDVVEQYSLYNNPKDLLIYIRSEGGNVYEGELIFDFLSSIELPKTTVTSYAYSIASYFPFIASEGNRFLENVSSDFMLHLPSYAELPRVNSIELEAYLDELKKLDEKMLDFYEKNTSVDRGVLKKMMERETFFNSSQCVSLGFFDDILIKDIDIDISKETKLKAVAFYKKDTANVKKDDNIIESNILEMEKKTKNALRVIAEALGLEKKAEFNYTDTDANGKVYNFTDDFGKPTASTEDVKGSLVVDDEEKKVINEEILLASGDVLTTDSEGRIKEKKEAEVKEDVSILACFEELKSTFNSTKEDMSARIEALSDVNSKLNIDIADLVEAKKELEAKIEKLSKISGKDVKIEAKNEVVTTEVKKKKVLDFLVEARKK